MDAIDPCIDKSLNDRPHLCQGAQEIDGAIEGVRQFDRCEAIGGVALTSAAAV